MKTFIASTLCAASLFASSAHAMFADTDQSGFYVSGLLGMSSPSESGFDDDKAMRLGVGFALNPTWLVEVNYVDLGEYKVSDRATLEAMALEIEQVLRDELPGYDVDVNSVALSTMATGLEVSLLGNYPLNDTVHLYGRLGLFKWEADAKTSVNVTIDGTREQFSSTDSFEDDIDVVYGLGAAFRVLPNLSLNVELSNYATSDMDNRVIGAGARWHF